MVDIKTVSLPDEPSQKWNGNRSLPQGVTHALNAVTNTPRGGCWAGFELPVFLTVFSVSLEEYVSRTASLSVNSCLEPALRLTDAPINHHGQWGTDAISHLIDSSGKKIAFWNGRQSRSGSIDFGSPQFIFINCKLGFGVWKEDTLVCVCVCFLWFPGLKGGMFLFFGNVH